MAYLGQVDRKASNVQVFNVTSSTSATHSIGWTPPSEQTLIITINGVKQHTNAYSFSGSTLTLGAALVATDELEVIGINDIGNSLTPVDSSVTASKLGADAVTTVKINDDAVTLAKMAAGTDGNLITYDASGDPAYVATGAATNILTSNGAGAAPTFQAATATTSDIELLNTYTPTGVADLEITTAAYFASTYSSLIFKFIHMQPATDNVHLRFSLGTGAGPTYDNDFYSFFGINQSNGSANAWQQDATYFSWPNTYATLFKEVGNGADENCSGNLEVFNASSATYEKMFNASLTGHLYHDYMLSTWSAGGFNLATACTAIKFFFSSGNIANGIVKVYGTR